MLVYGTNGQGINSFHSLVDSLVVISSLIESKVINVFWKAAKDILF